jgi:hypothetical protein
MSEMAATTRQRVRSRRKRKATASPPLSLAEVQARFQDAVTAGDDSILALIPDNSRTGANVLLGVYRHAYVARLIEVIRTDHEMLASYLGDAEFDRLARAYVRACPSNTQNARWFCHRLPDFIAAAADYRTRPEIAELAALERALNDAFDAADAAVLDLAALGRHAADAWGDLVFTPHPSAARLDLATNAFALWRALKDGEAPPAAEVLSDPDRLIVWRKDMASTVRTLEPEEAMMWDEAAKGARFASLCELVATFGGSDGAALRAAQYLQGWIVSGKLADASLKRKAPRPRRDAAADPS